MKNDYDYVSKQIKEMIGILLDLKAFDKEDIDIIISVIKKVLSKLDKRVKESNDVLNLTDLF